MDIGHTIDFLRMLEPENFETHQFCWTGSHPETKKRLQAYGTFEELLPRLQQRNAEGFGIFVAINAIDTPSFEGGYARRRTEDVTRVRSCFADWDDPNKVLPEFPLAPTMVVETSENKYHIHWCADDVPLDEFEIIQRGIAQVLGSDQSVVDLPRELRVPGFLHTKNLAKRTLVTLAESDGPRYTFAQLKEAFPFDAARKAPKFSTWGGSVERKAQQTAAVIAANYLPRPDGGYNIRCPWSSEHTTPDTPSCSTYWPPGERNDGRGSYVCKHAHCVGRMVDELDSWVSVQVAGFLA
jgi:hypothetical protein